MKQNQNSNAQNQQQPQQTLPTPNSLVKYASAVLVSTSGKAHVNEKGKAYASSITSHQTEAILNSILPPREYIMNKQQLWIQKVSATPATKSDVLELVNNLDKRLQQRGAKQCGLCPIREELYAQCFDELIRQITINCSERGLMLLRVRDEIKYTIQQYQTLYESATAYGMRKYLNLDTKKTDMDIHVKQLENQCNDLQNQVDTLEKYIKETEFNFNLQKEMQDKQHQEEVQQIKKINQKYKQDLQKLLSGNDQRK